MELTILPFRGVNLDALYALEEDVRPFGFCASISSVLCPPAEAFNRRRNKYVADELLRFLRRFPGQRVLGVIQDDMYRFVLDYIRGFADLPGRVAVISLARLYDTDDTVLLRKRIRNLALHELGHTQGLEHCADYRCLMYGGNWPIELGEAQCYCHTCAARLEVSVVV